MDEVIDMTGADTSKQVWVCAKCGATLWNDHGWVLASGSVVCRREDKCFERSIKNKIDAEKAAGTWKPKWRKG